MTKIHNNLRFLLALGGKRVVVMQENNNLHVYSDHHAGRNATVSVERISEAVAAK